ncbi:MAG: hypothetical protein Q7U51_07610 [Methanoregula sp.]|nr:hypothetical protein [Methanoregula sp.]
MPLDPRDVPLLAQASSQAIQTSFDNLSNNFNDESWINKNNFYYRDCVGKVSRKYSKGSRILDSDLSEYISASVPLHCIDGWSYLGRAIECHCRGDIANSKHLAYYAELRATMSILASQGIGIFNKRHVVVDSNSECIGLYTETGTHIAAWLLLEEWASSNSAKNLITSVIQPRNIPLSNWLSSFSGTSSYQMTINKLLKRWGLDLQIFGTCDKDARNESSYRPQRIINTNAQNFNHDLNYLCEFWDVFEYTGSGFEKLDYYLLRLSLTEIFATVNKNQNFQSDPNLYKQFESRVNSLIDNLGIKGDEKIRIQNLLTNLNGKNPLVIEEANKQDPLDSYNQHVQMLSRASLLLRIASGASANLFSQAKFPVDDLKFWWNPFGIERGLWKPDEEPDDFGDLWEDISDILNRTWGYAKEPGMSLCNLHQKQNETYSVAKLGECERIALWGFDL